MKKKSIFALILLSLISNIAVSQNVKIKGNANVPNALVRLLTYDDMLTYEQNLVSETKSDDKGDFFIETEISDVTMAQIAVNLERVDLLIKPDATYELEISIPEQKDDVSYFERENPSLKIININDDELYSQYHVSNMIIDDFIYNNFNQLYRNRRLSLLDTLDVAIKRIIPEIKSDFVKDNIRYRKAAIQMVVNNDNGKKVVNQYFNKQDVLYSNPAYMSLFHELFANYLSSGLFNASEMRRMLYEDYGVFMTYLKGKDVFLAENQNLAELVVAYNLKRMFY
jgi:hypothetical protein